MLLLSRTNHITIDAIFSDKGVINDSEMGDISPEASNPGKELELNVFFGSTPRNWDKLLTM